MAGKSSSSDDDAMITDINVTPLVDIILVLLITFMLTASLIERQAIKMELPKAATGEANQPSSLALMLDRDNTLYLNGKVVTEAALRTALPQLVHDAPTLQAIIAADAQVPHGSVVRLIDWVRQAGIQKFAINIDPAADPNAP